LSTQTSRSELVFRANLACFAAAGGQPSQPVGRCVTSAVRRRCWSTSPSKRLTAVWWARAALSASQGDPQSDRRPAGASL